MTRRICIIVLVALGVGLSVGGVVALGSTTNVSGTQATAGQARCGSPLTSDDRGGDIKVDRGGDDTKIYQEPQLGYTCAVVRGVAKTVGVIAVSVGVALLLAALGVTCIRPVSSQPEQLSLGHPR